MIGRGVTTIVMDTWLSSTRSDGWTRSYSSESDFRSLSKVNWEKSSPSFVFIFERRGFGSKEREGAEESSSIWMWETFFSSYSSTPESGLKSIESKTADCSSRFLLDIMPYVIVDDTKRFEKSKSKEAARKLG